MRDLARLAIVLVLGCSAQAEEANSWPIPPAAEKYVRLAWTNNLSLQEKSLDVESAEARAAMARGLRQPRLDLVGRFTRASGGRLIEVPSGDLLNPVHAALNDLLQAQGRPANFPTVANLAIPLLRAQEQETKLRLTAPLFNASLRQLDRSGRAAAAAAVAEQGAYRRDVRLAVIQAYYLCLTLQASEQILTGATHLTAEALRVARALAAADKATEDQVLRAEADDLAVKQQLIGAQNELAAARRGLNALVNRPLEEPLEPASADEVTAVVANLASRPMPAAHESEAREEFAALRAAEEAAAAAEGAVRARAQPSVALVVEGGIQGPSYRVGSDTDYATGSLVAEMNLWDGRQRQSEAMVARAQRRRVLLQTEATRQQIAAEAASALDTLAAARAALPAAERRASAAHRALELVAAREREGLVNQLAFLDAREADTTAALNLAITRLQLLLAGARVDRALALTPLTP